MGVVKLKIRQKSNRLPFVVLSINGIIAELTFYDNQKCPSRTFLMYFCKLCDIMSTNSRSPKVVETLELYVIILAGQCDLVCTVHFL